MAVSNLPDELLMEIFDWCRLAYEYCWNYQRRWFNLLQVCRRWRYIMLEWASSLKLHLLCNFSKHITAIPSHLSSLPLIISFRFDPTVPPQCEQELLLTLQLRKRVRAITIDKWCSGGSELWRALDKTFPMLETLSLSEDYTTEMLPYDIVAPHLRALHLQSIAIQKGSSLLTNATSMTSLRLESIPASGHFSPEYLVERIACMPHLEDMFIGFYPESPLPDTVIELSDTQTTRASLPRLSTFEYKGIGAYLEDLLTLIGTPFLQDFRFTLSIRETITVYRLPPFLGTIQNLNLRTALMQFSPQHVTIEYHPGHPSVTLPYLYFFPDTLEGTHAAASVVQICSAIAPALPVVENLELRAWSGHSWESSQFQPALWHRFLRLFGGVKRLSMDICLVTELSSALDPNNGAVIKDLLPMLSELVVNSWGDLVHQSFASFIHARRLSGHSIDLRISQTGRTSWETPHISWPFDTFL